ncbi:hypothetical protein IBX73_05560 [candidate division WOR-3 bacterium]|nr:hypothetical protein [candidate division WOR-3 bacterium]
MILSLISILAITVAVVIYRRQPVQLVLRLAALVVMYLLISNYTIVIARDGRENDAVVLVDHSESMARHLNQIRDVVSQIEFPHRVLYFNENLLSATEPERLGSYTNLTRALEEAGRMQPSAIMLITDGNHNFGASPLTLADRTNSPIHIYGIGEDTIRDAAIIGIIAPAYTYQGDSAQIDVMVESSGFTAGDGRVALGLTPDKPLAARDFPLSDVRARNTVTFRVAAAAPGEIRYSINIEPLPGEISYDNNRSFMTLNVLKDKIRVLYYTDHMSFNTKFIRASLSSDGNLSVSSIVRHGAVRYRSVERGEDLAALPGLDGFDVVILDNVNLARLPWSNILESAGSGKGLVLTGMIEGFNEQWRENIPIKVAGGAVEGKHTLRINEPFSVLTGGDHPPVKRISRIAGARPDAKIVASVGDLPVIGYCAHQKGRIFQIAIPDFGTWNFLQRGLMNKDLLSRFLGDVIRFLSPLGAHERLMLAARQADCAVGEIVHLQLQSHDRDLRPAGDGDFSLVAGSTRIPFYETHYGRYEASIVFDKPGKQRVFAQGELDGELLTSNTVNMNVMPGSLEAERRLNQALLQTIAAAADGEFMMLDDLNRTTPPETRRRATSTAINLNSPVTYFAVFLMLAADWILRRRRGIT